MFEQWGIKAKKKLSLIVAVVLVLAISGGAFAYTYTTTIATISVPDPTANVATANASDNQPDWDSVTANLSASTVCGEVPTGDLFDITPNGAYTGDLQVGVYLTNASNLIKAYKYLNVKLYMEGSDVASETPDYRVLSLQNGEASFRLLSLTSTAKSWTQTSQADFQGGTLNQVDATTSPGDVILDTFTDDVTDSFNDQSKIASLSNVTVSGGQVKLSYNTGATGTETLRPNAAGDETLIAEQFPNTGAHWDKVDDGVTPDEDSTYVRTNASGWEEDLYNLPNHATGMGRINYVRVYMRVRSLVIPVAQDSAYVHIKTNGVEYNGSTVGVTNSYANYSNQWINNPQTGSAWTWTEIDNLQAGVGLRRATTGGGTSTRYTQCTQVYVEVNYTPYYTLGTITSVNLLSGEAVVSIDGFYYDASAIPSGTGLRVQFSQDNANWYNSSGTPSGWDTLSQGSATISLSSLGWSGPNFYYHMEFTSNGANTPVLDEIRVYFSTYYSSGDLTSSTHDGEDYGNWDWGTISFTINEPSGTNIQFQLRSAATQGGLSTATWYGPTGTGDYYITSGTAINSVHDGDRWIQYKAYFTSTGAGTPKLSDVTITYVVALQSFIIRVIGGGYCLISDNTSEWAAGWTTTPEFFCQATQR